MKATQLLDKIGQSLWLDNITRDLLGPASASPKGGGLTALGAALYSIGIPKDSIVTYETALKADKFLLLVHGAPPRTC